MPEQTRPDTSPAQPTGGANEVDIGVPQSQRTPGKAEGDDPAGPRSKPQGTLEDQEKNMDSEGHLVPPPPNEAG